MSDQAFIQHGEFGTLAIDSVDGRLQCHHCGVWRRNLAAHVLRAHRVRPDEYRALVGLNRQTRLFSADLRAEVRQRTRPLIASLRAKGKLRNWGEDRERFERDKAAAIDTLHDGLRGEGVRHRRESYTPEDRAARAERLAARNRAGQHRASGAAISAGLRRALSARLCDRCGQQYQPVQGRQRYCTSCQSVVRREQYRAAAARRRLRQREGDEAAPRRSNPLVRDQSRDTICRACGATFRARSHREAICADCRPARATLYQQRYRNHRK